MLQATHPRPASDLTDPDGPFTTHVVGIGAEFSSASTVAWLLSCDDRLSVRDRNGRSVVAGQPA
jgi:hypothetical protein